MNTGDSDIKNEMEIKTNHSKRILIKFNEIQVH